MTTETPLTAPTLRERNWAMLAHLTALLTVAVGAATGGAAAVLALLVPLGMYLYFGSRSRYVAFHALQATVYQAVAALAYVAVAALAGTLIAIAWVVAGVLTVVLVGFLLMPLALGLTLMLGAELAALPVLMLAYALYGALQAYEGREFRYWLVGDVVARTVPPNTTMMPPVPMA